MRRLLTGGIKAILAIAALSTGAHWALRVQREAPAPQRTAAAADPVTTGAIEPTRTERVLPSPTVAAPPLPGPAARPRAERLAPTLDQRHLADLIASHSSEKARPQKAAATTTAKR